MGKITENGLLILKEKEYFKEGEHAWKDICKRVASTMSQGEITEENKSRQEREIYDSMSKMEFVFSSPALINADPEKGGQYSSCFIIDIKDDLMSIMGAVPRMAKIFQKAGGVGISNLSVLRPKKSRVENSAGYSCGPIGFMKIYNTTAEVMTEENKSKRGALKMNLDVWHPDIIDFINCKNEDGVLTLMNISVSVSDEFMKAVKEDKMWDLEFPDFENVDKEIYNKQWDGVLEAWKEKGYPTRLYKTIRARELKNMIDVAMWTRGEPGINYQDRMDRDNKNPKLGRRIATNPCNEYTNLPNTSCTLGSINLVEFYDELSEMKFRDMHLFDETIDNNLNSEFNYNTFSNAVKNGVRWLDNMVSVNHLPLPEIQEMTERVRSIGLGIMGFGSLLYKLRIPYGNNEKCMTFINSLMENMKYSAIAESVRLSAEKGVYPEWEHSKWYDDNIKIRNSDLISIAPNGTISALAGVSGGIEPEFALVYKRRTNNGEYYDYVNEDFLTVIKEEGLDVDYIIDKVRNNHGSCQGIEEIPQRIRDVFVTAHDISPEDHIRVLAQFQKYTDLSISKTINFKNDATVEDIKSIIDLGWELGCKGIAVYRDGCRKFQTLSTGKDDKNEKEELNYVEKLSNKVLVNSTLNNMGIKNTTTEELSKCRFNLDNETNKVTRNDFGRKLSGNTYTAETACGKFYLTLNRDPRDGKIIEAFINIKDGLCKSNTDALTRMISLSLQEGVDAEKVVDKLRGINCTACAAMKNRKHLDGISCPDAMARLLQQEIDIAKEKHNDDVKLLSVDYGDNKYDHTSMISYMKNDIMTIDSIGKIETRGLCPDCGHELPPGRCIQCSHCGYTTC